jgi:hypothetical protein
LARTVPSGFRPLSALPGVISTLLPRRLPESTRHRRLRSIETLEQLEMLVQREIWMLSIGISELARI